MPFCGYLSETSRMLELHRALRERGAPVRVATQGGGYESLLRGAGVDYDLVGAPMTAARAARLVAEALGQGNVLRSMYRDDELRAYVRAEVDYFRAHRVRVVVTGFTLTTVLSARLAGATLVTEHAGSWVPPMLGPRPLHRLPLYTRGFNRVARELGAPRVGSVGALVRGDLTLVPEAPYVLGRSTLPAGYRITGPLYAHLDLPVPEPVRAFLAGPGPRVYVAITSTPPDVVRRAVRSLLRHDVRILVAGTTHDLRDLAGPRVTVAGVLPSHLIMPGVDVAVTAGGQGSVQTAMAGGTPLVGLPLHAEQWLNVRLVAQLGAARMIRRPSDAGTAVAAVLADPRYRSAAHRIRSEYDRIDGPALAAEAVIDAAA